MKNFKPFGTLLIAGALALSMGSCKKKEKAAENKPAGEVIVDQHCSGPEYFTNKKNFRANATGESLDRMTAKKKALSNARAQLAADIENTMKVVGDNYVKSSEFNNKEEITETFQEMARTVVDQQLTGLRTICEKLTQKPSGKYVSYIAIELSAEELVSEYNERLSNDERLRADYNYEKFKETFDKEMEKLSNQ